MEDKKENLENKGTREGKTIKGECKKEKRES